MLDSDTDYLDFENTEAAYDMLAERVEIFIEAWEAGGKPPALEKHLPCCTAALRNMALVELIKVDLEYRQKHGCRRKLDEYLDEFPELVAGGAAPLDLVYEDFHVRKQAGETVVLQPYFDRFPNHRTKLEQMLGLGQGYQSTRVYMDSTRVEAEPGCTLDDFDLIKELGAGAFAKVFLARQVSMQRFVALKVSADQSDEPQTLAQLDHPHIVRVFDQRLIPEKQTRLLYMQYVPGGTLDDVIKTSRDLPPEERSGKLVLEIIDESLERRGELLPSESFSRRALNDLSWPEAVCRIGASLASALDYAHRRGVLHRDVKPANVLLTSEGSPKLADFNISFSSEVEGASPREFFGGSLAYMSPEQLEAYDPNHERQPEDIDGRADLYSLAMLLWEMLAGRRPFEDRMLPQGMEATIREMTGRRREGVPGAAIKQLPTDCPAGLEDVLLTCLEPEADDRLADAGQMARQLELCLDAEVQDLLYPPEEDAWRTRVARWPLGVLPRAITPKSWRRLACTWPLAAILLCILVANVPLSYVNIRYNLSAIIEGLGKDPMEFFQNVQVTAVNIVAYGLGIGLLLASALPVARALKKTRQSEPLGRALWRRCGARCLELGRYAFWLGVVLWTGTSFVFPTWIKLVDPDVEIALGEYFHFFTSTLICGLIAASLTYFLVTYVCVRAFYPALIPPDAADPDAAEELSQASRPLTRVFFLLVAVPMGSLAIATLPALGAVKSDAGASFFMLGVIGLAGFGLCLTISRTILSDLGALRLAVCPAEEQPDLDSPSTLLGSTRHRPRGLSRSETRSQ